MALSLVNTALVAFAELGREAGYIGELELTAVGTGATLIAAATVGWVMTCATRTRAFDRGNAEAYEGLVREGVNKGRIDELRMLAEALRVSARRLVAYAGEYSTGNGANGKREQEARARAVRIVQQMASEELMRAICLEGGRVITEVAEEARLRRAQEESPAHWHGTSRLMHLEREILRAATREAVRQRCPLVRDEDIVKATVVRVYGTPGGERTTTVDRIWGNKELLGRCGNMAWPLVGFRSEDLDEEKLEAILLTGIDTDLNMAASDPTGTNIWQLIQCWIWSTGWTEKGRLRRAGAFLRRVHGVMTRRETIAREERAREGRAGGAPPSILSIPTVLADKVADCLIDVMWNAGRNGSTGMECWDGWLGIRGQHGGGNEHRDDGWLVNTIGRKLDVRIWKKIRGMKRGTLLPVEMGFLSYYLRMEGMKTKPLILPDAAQAPATYRRRMWVHRAVRRLCQRHLIEAVRRRPETREMLEQDGLRLEDDARKLTYVQRTGLGSVTTWELDLDDKADGRAAAPSPTLPTTR